MKTALKAVPAKTKRTRIRAIDNGTRYDIIGNLRRIEREIERGEHGDLGNLVLLFAEKEDNCIPHVEMRHFGTGTIPEIHWMLETAKNRIEPR
jgi:hypothetical protein